MIDILPVEILFADKFLIKSFDKELFTSAFPAQFTFQEILLQLKNFQLWSDSSGNKSKKNFEGGDLEQIR